MLKEIYAPPPPPPRRRLVDNNIRPSPIPQQRYRSPNEEEEDDDAEEIPLYSSIFPNIIVHKRVDHRDDDYDETINDGESHYYGYITTTTMTTSSTANNIERYTPLKFGIYPVTVTSSTDVSSASTVSFDDTNDTNTNESVDNQLMMVQRQQKSFYQKDKNAKIIDSSKFIIDKSNVNRAYDDATIVTIDRDDSFASTESVDDTFRSCTFALVVEPVDTIY